jgi:CDP-diacylglycerol---serine O-phosphatidyltransferase
VAVPSFFTLMNLFSGFVSLTQAMEGRFENAAWLIVLAAFFDLLDGMMARLTNGASLFGVELDSLSDIVSFGVAPSFLVFAYGLHEFGTVGLIVATLPAVCGAVRLARYNVNFDGDKKTEFVGLPIPAQAAVIVAVILNAPWLDGLAGIDTTNISFLGPLMVFLSVLMISPIRFESPPIPSPELFRREPRRAILYSLALILVIVIPKIGVLVNLVGYLALGLGGALRTMIRAILDEEDEDAEKEGPNPSDSPEG